MLLTGRVRWLILTIGQYRHYPYVKNIPYQIYIYIYTKKKAKILCVFSHFYTHFNICYPRLDIPQTLGMLCIDCVAFFRMNDKYNIFTYEMIYTRINIGILFAHISPIHLLLRYKLYLYYRTKIQAQFTVPLPKTI